MSFPLTDIAQVLPAETVFACLERVRSRAPRVHAITNTVAQGLTANTLLALGAVPSMTIAADEVAGFVASADALLVNLGTLDQDRRAAIPAALEAAAAAGHPVVLDPVFVDRSPHRAAYARELLGARPVLVRANEAEIAALFPKPAALNALIADGTTVVVTGGEDRIEGPGADHRLLNGHPLLARATATGCASGAVLAAFASVEPDSALAAACGLSVFNIAGEIAAERAAGPGSLVPDLLDALYVLDAGDIERRLRTA